MDRFRIRLANFHLLFAIICCDRSEPTSFFKCTLF